MLLAIESTLLWERSKHHKDSRCEFKRNVSLVLKNIHPSTDIYYWGKLSSSTDVLRLEIPELYANLIEFIKS